MFTKEVFAFHKDCDHEMLYKLKIHETRLLIKWLKVTENMQTSVKQVEQSLTFNFV